MYNINATLTNDELNLAVDWIKKNVLNRAYYESEQYQRFKKVVKHDTRNFHCLNMRFEPPYDDQLMVAFCGEFGLINKTYKWEEESKKTGIQRGVFRGIRESILHPPYLEQSIIAGGFLRNAILKVISCDTGNSASDIWPTSDIDIFCPQFNKDEKAIYGTSGKVSTAAFNHDVGSISNEYVVDIVSTNTETAADRILKFDTDYNMIYMYVLDVLEAIVNYYPNYLSQKQKEYKPLTIPIYFPKLEVINRLYTNHIDKKTLIYHLNKLHKLSGNIFFMSQLSMPYPEEFCLCNVENPLGTLSRMVYFYRKMHYQFMKPSRRQVRTLITKVLAKLLQDKELALPSSIPRSFYSNPNSIEPDRFPLTKSDVWHDRNDLPPTKFISHAAANLHQRSLDFTLPKAEGIEDSLSITTITNKPDTNLINKTTNESENTNRKLFFLKNIMAKQQIQ